MFRAKLLTNSNIFRHQIIYLHTKKLFCYMECLAKMQIQQLRASLINIDTTYKNI